MQTVSQVIDERLGEAGDTLPVRGHVAEQSYVLGGHSLALPSGVDYDLMLTNAGEGILVTGMLTAHVVGTCDRCLDVAEFDVAGEVDEYYLFHAPDEAPTAGEFAPDADHEYVLVGADHTIDLTDALETALIMETPYVILCDEDCKGLCPVCGTNLNHKDCGHASAIARRREQDRLASSPFAVLRNLSIEDDEGSDTML